MLKNEQKLKKIHNIFTYSSFPLLQGCPLKSYINTFHYYHTIYLSAKRWPSRPTILSVSCKFIYMADKITNFLMKYQLVEPDMVFIVVFE